MRQMSSTRRRGVKAQRRTTLFTFALCLLMAMIFGPVAVAQEATPSGDAPAEITAAETPPAEAPPADDTAVPPPVETTTALPIQEVTEIPAAPPVETEAPAAPATEAPTESVAEPATEAPATIPAEELVDQDLPLTLVPLPDDEPVTVGSEVTARLTWPETTEPAPDGTIVWRLHTGTFTGENDACPITDEAKAEAVATQEPVPVTTDGAPDALPETITAAGDYSWVVDYFPASDDYAPKTVCAPFTVGKVTPALTDNVLIPGSPGAVAGPGGVVLAGTTIPAGGLTLATTLDGAWRPAGSVTYTVYADAACTVPMTDLPGFPEAVDVTADSPIPHSAPFDLAVPGDYSWQAVYSGDNDNIGAAGPCQRVSTETVPQTPAPTVSPLPQTPQPLALTVVSRPDISFGTLSPADATRMDDGELAYTIDGAVSITATGPDAGWSVQCAVTLTAGTLPASALSWQLDGGDGTWTPFSTAAAPCSPIQTGTDVTLTYNLRLIVPASAPAGSFSYALTYTVVPVNGG